MTDHTEVSAPTDAELRALWNEAGGTFYSANREIGSMPVRALIPFLRRLVQGAPAFISKETSEPGVGEIKDPARQRASAPATALSDNRFELALAALVSAVLPDTDSGDLFVDASKAIASFDHAELAGHFGIDDEPCTDGSARYVMVGAQHASDEDVFPLYRRARMKGEPAEAPAAPAAPARKSAKKAAGQAAGGAA